jgi:hypothetical protein
MVLRWVKRPGDPRRKKKHPAQKAPEDGVLQDGRRPLDMRRKRSRGSKRVHLGAGNNSALAGRACHDDDDDDVVYWYSIQ